MKYHIYIVYETTNLINKKKYRGVHQTKNLDDGYLGSGKQLIEDIERFGVENFSREILGEYSTSKEMFDAEKKFVDRDWVDRSDTYNLKTGGHGGWDHENLDSEKQREKGKRCGPSLKRKHREDLEWSIKMRKVSSENIKKAYRDGKVKHDNFTGKRHTKEAKKKIGSANSIHQRGKNNNQYGTIWVCNGIEVKKIKKEDFDWWKNFGYHRGRK